MIDELLAEYGKLYSAIISVGSDSFKFRGTRKRKLAVAKNEIQERINKEYAKLGPEEKARIAEIMYRLYAVYMPTYITLKPIDLTEEQLIKAIRGKVPS